MRTIPELIQTIRQRGGKVTPQRLVIYEALERGPAHPSAEAVFEAVRKQLPTVSRATVYKTLNELVAMGELRRFDVNGVSHFDTTTVPHAEVVCLGCSAIADVAWSPLPAFPSVPDFHILGQSQTFYGYCSACQPAQQHAS